MPGSFRVHKKVINESGSALLCCWDDCLKTGYDCHQARVNYGGTVEHSDSICLPNGRGGIFHRCSPPHVVKFVFCSDRHKAYWTASHRYNQGMLAPGDKSLPIPV